MAGLSSLACHSRRLASFIVIQAPLRTEVEVQAAQELPNELPSRRTATVGAPGYDLSRDETRRDENPPGLLILNGGRYWT